MVMLARTTAEVDALDYVFHVRRTLRRRLTCRQYDVLFRWVHGQSLAEIGRHYGISRERARQILTTARIRSSELFDADRDIGLDVIRELTDRGPTWRRSAWHG